MGLEVVATGLYLDDLNAEFRRDAMMFVGKIVGLSLLLAALVVLIKRALTLPVRAGGGHAPGGRAARPHLSRAIAQPGRAGHGEPRL